MKLALFFVLSFVVHATAFLVPVSLNGRASARAIIVTILPLESGSELRGSASVPLAESRPSATKVVKTNSPNRSSASALSPAVIVRETTAAEAVTPTTDKIVSSIVGLPVTSVSNNSDGFTATAVGTGISSLTAARPGLGNGFGNGDGFASGPDEATLTQARYRETPQPDYPDSARRAGKEGRVLLRVLIDAEGRAKAIEVNSSSGHEVLDQAATEALKKWRFVPARAGGKPVETWVKVPIEFQLSNAR